MFYLGISAEPLGHGNKVELTKLPRFKKELRLAEIFSCMHDGTVLEKHRTEAWSKSTF